MTIRRAKGTGSIRKTGNSYYWRITINGKKVVKRLDANNDQEADLEATRLYTIASAKTQEEVALFAGRARKIIADNKSILLKAVFAKFEASSVRPTCSAATLQQHKGYWMRFADWINLNAPQITTLEQINKDIAIEYFDYIIQEKSARTFNAILNSLKLIYKTVSNDKINPFSSIRKRDENTQTRKEFSFKQLEKIFKSIDNKTLHLMNRDEMRVMFYIGAFTGLRLKNCCLLQWSDVDMNNNIVRCKPFKTIKNKKFVNIPIHPRLTEQFIAAKNWKINDYVLPKNAQRYIYNEKGISKDAKKIIDFSMWKKPQKYKRAPVCDGYTFHSLRHTFVSICANGGVPLSVVQEIVGHGNPAMTKYYTHVGTDSLKKAINTLPGSQKDSLSTENKLKQIRELLDGEKLTAREKKILKIMDL